MNHTSDLAWSELLPTILTLQLAGGGVKAGGGGGGAKRSHTWGEGIYTHSQTSHIFAFMLHCHSRATFHCANIKTEKKIKQLGTHLMTLQERHTDKQLLPRERDCEIQLLVDWPCKINR